MRFVDNYLGYLLGQANHAVYKQFARHVQSEGLSGTEWRVLAVLHAGESLSVSALAQEVLSKQPTLTKLVQRMQARGWVACQADAADQRRTLVDITPAGRQVATRLLAKAKRQEARLLRSFDAAEIGALKAALLKIAAEPSQ